MSNAIQKTEERSLAEYIPLGGHDKIKLTVKMVQQYITIPTKSGKTCSERDAVRFIGLCVARRLSPLEGDCFLQGYDTVKGPAFELITAYQALIKRAEIHPRFDGLKSGVIVRENGRLENLTGDFYLIGEQELLGGWAHLKLKDVSIPMEERLNLKVFMKVNDNGDPMARWKVDPGGMIVKCAEASCLRRAFPTVCGGLFLRQEVEVMPEGEGLGALPILPAENLSKDNDDSNPDLSPENVKGQPAAASQASDSPQAQIQKLAEDNGCAFDAYQRWGEGSGNDTDAGSRSTWPEIPGELAKRFLRNKTMFVAGLKSAKEGK